MAQHALLLKKETTNHTFNTPAAGDAQRVEDATSNLSQNVIENRETGAGEGLSDAYNGLIKPNGNIKAILAPERFGELLLSLLRGLNTSTPSGATNARDHVFEPDDAASPVTLSMQMQRSNNGATVTNNMKGVYVMSAVLEISEDQKGTLTLTYMAQDEALAGATFADTSASPATVSPSYPALIEKFNFKNMTIKAGGTFAVDADRIPTLTGASDLTGVVSLRLEINLNGEQGGALASSSADHIVRGNRNVTLDMTIRNNTPASAWYSKVRNDTREAIQIAFTTAAEIDSGVNSYQLECTLPEVMYSGDNTLGNVSPENGQRTIDVKATGMVDDIANKDIMIRLRDSNTGY